MGLLSWIILGGLCGAIAKAIMPGKDPGGMLVTIAIGVAGGILGGLVSTYALGISMGGFWNLRSWVIATVGAVALLGLYRLVNHFMAQREKSVESREYANESRNLQSAPEPERAPEPPRGPVPNSHPAAQRDNATEQIPRPQFPPRTGGDIPPHPRNRW